MNEIIQGHEPHELPKNRGIYSNLWLASFTWDGAFSEIDAEYYIEGETLSEVQYVLDVVFQHFPARITSIKHCRSRLIAINKPYLAAEMKKS